MKKTFFLNMMMGSAILLSLSSAQAAISLDRTRVIFPGSEKSVSLNISNQNESLPYLAQSWLEDEKGQKISATGPLAVVPPVQRLEPKGKDQDSKGSKSQVRVMAMPSAAQLPQDRESLFYFNLREIPPKSDKANVLQIALQTRIKLFYRPAAIAESVSGQQAKPFQEGLTLTRNGDRYTVNNPSPYYVTILGASATKGGTVPQGFEAMMVAPKSSAPLGGSASALGSAPVLVYVNDFGGQPALTFRCGGNTCQVDESKEQNN